MSLIYLVPNLYSKGGNPFFYCNYARENTKEERCLKCKVEKCRHKGKHTIIDKK